jgi:hypothetical protein
MYGAQRRFFSWMTVAAALLCVAPVALGAPDLGLALAPVLLVYGLLVCGRYVGEERILARWRAGAAHPRRVRRRSERWLPRAVPRLRSLYEHDSFGVRGPPALLAPAA